MANIQLPFCEEPKFSKPQSFLLFSISLDWDPFVDPDSSLQNVYQR